MQPTLTLRPLVWSLLAFNSYKVAFSPSGSTPRQRNHHFLRITCNSKSPFLPSRLGDFFLQPRDSSVKFLMVSCRQLEGFQAQSVAPVRSVAGACAVGSHEFSSQEAVLLSTTAATRKRMLGAEAPNTFKHFSNGPSTSERRAKCLARSRSAEHQRRRFKVKHHVQAALNTNLFRDLFRSCNVTES
jgi:hypothetical protein